ncbi:MAG: 30S ribosomal protein S17 [Pseudomonadota bacterium]
MSIENAVEKQPKTLIAKVISDKMQKSVVVLYETKVKHEMYDKYVSKNTKLMAHDEADNCKEGDTVVIQECRPYSRRKRWKVVEILSKKQ